MSKRPMIAPSSASVCAYQAISAGTWLGGIGATAIAVSKGRLR